MTVPGPAGRDSREQVGAFLETAAEDEDLLRELTAAVDEHDAHGVGVITLTTHGKIAVALKALADRLNNPALDRLSPSGEGEERKDADRGLHERGGQT